MHLNIVYGRKSLCEVYLLTGKFTKKLSWELEIAFTTAKPSIVGKPVRIHTLQAHMRLSM